MILNETEELVLTNSKKESKFSITANGKMFKILSSGIYQHKIAAIVRELSCNAFDAHVDAGTSCIPFRIVLPNDMHPYFEVEDFGIGMDDDTVREVFTAYGESTKTGSNSHIGAFGLGSKTPFSYTSTFTIRARKDGVERLYSAYMGSDGAPSINLMRETETTECSGVKITVPVSNGVDQFRFKYESQFILSFFGVLPEVSDRDFQFSSTSVAEKLQKSNIVVEPMTSNSSLYSSSVYAVMGGVCYPVSRYWISTNIKDDLVEYLNKIPLKDDRNRLFIKFPIGTLEPTVSRESLEMTKDTEKALVEGIVAAIEELKVQDQEEVDAFDNIFKAMFHIQNKYRLHTFNKIFSYRGTPLNKYNEVSLLKRLRPMRYYAYSGKGRIVSVTSNYNLTIRQLFDIDTVKVIYTSKGDTTRGMIKHARLMARACGVNSDTTVVTFNEVNIEAVKKYFSMFPFNMEYHSLKDLVEEEKKHKASLPKGVRQASTRLGKMKDSEVSASGYSYNAETERTSELIKQRMDLSDQDCFYMLFDDKEDDFKADGFCIPCLTSFLEYLSEKHGVDEIVFLKRTMQNTERLSKNNVSEIEPLFLEYFETIKLEYITSFIANHWRIEYYHGNKVKDVISVLKGLGYDTMYVVNGYNVDITDKVNCIHVDIEKATRGSSVTDKMQVTDLYKAVDEGFTGYCTKLFKDFPMLQHVDKFTDENIQDVTNYIKDVDSRLKEQYNLEQDSVSLKVA